MRLARHEKGARRAATVDRIHVAWVELKKPQQKLVELFVNRLVAIGVPVLRFCVRESSSHGLVHEQNVGNVVPGVGINENAVS